MAESGERGGRARVVAAAAFAALLAAAACARGGDADLAALARARAKAAPAAREWRTYLGDAASRQWSPVDAIHAGNVAELEVAWRYDARGPDGELGEIQCNPLVVKGVLYGTSPSLRLFALDAETGAEIWSYRPRAGARSFLPNRNRGLVYWEDARSGDERLFYVVNQYLLAVDARTGRAVESFGDGGRIDIGEGLPRADRAGAITSNTPGVVFEDALIVPTRVNELAGAAPGHVRAFDVRTGALRWTFETIPRPGAPGADTWPDDAWKEIGGANSWAGMALDVERGLVFVPTGSAAFDYYGGDRAGDNLFANSLLALDARTGERRWHYQIVRHDLWDRDLPQPPNLVTIERDGARIDAVSQVTKSGHVFVFDRETGAPLHPIEEVAVRGEPLPGEAPARTQPLPVRPPPLARQVLDASTATDRTEAARAAVLRRLDEVESGPPFTLPSRRPTVLMPGLDGGAEWGGAAFDDETGLLYVNVNDVPYLLQMTDFEREVGARNSGEMLYFLYCGGCHGADRAGDGYGTPSLVGVGERLGYFATHRVVRDGRGRMPGFGASLPWWQRALIVGHVRRAGGAATPPASAAGGAPPAAAPSSRGYFANGGWHRFSDPDGFPAIRPPWGTLAAVDLARGEIAWQVPLGDYPATLAAGRSGLGAESYGGPVATAGGLVFIAATPDAKLRAFDKWTGELRFEADLPAAGYATPAVYEVAGRPFVAVAAGGGKLGTPKGASWVAFSLPR
ncbi:MAG: PQQ-binding-like beta-propeller repeat protein [Myxococcota bacterium]